jgi:hypothetical protein
MRCSSRCIGAQVLLNEYKIWGRGVCYVAARLVQVPENRRTVPQHPCECTHACGHDIALSWRASVLARIQ